MKIKDFRGRVYSVRETIKAEILHSDHGDGHLEMLHDRVNRLADYTATLIQILAEQKVIDEATLLRMCGYGSSIVPEMNLQPDKDT